MTGLMVSFKSKNVRKNNNINGGKMTFDKYHGIYTIPSMGGSV